MKKKLGAVLALTLSGAVLLSACQSGQGTDGSDSKKSEGGTGERETITYNGYWCESDYEHDNYVEKMIEDALNINIDVVTKDTADTIDLMLASGEMPDCMWLDKDVAWMYDQELVRPIPKSMVEEYTPTLLEYYDKYPLMHEKTLNPENKDEFLYLTGVTFQFTDYYLPGDYYRYDWIENLGIDLGVNVEQVADNLYIADDGIEVSKFKEIMDAFVNKDPDGNGKDDTVGASAAGFVQSPFFTGYNFHPGVNNVNGRAEQYYVMDEYKDFLKGFKEMYSNHLIDPEILSEDRTLSWDKVNSEVSGYWITSTNSLNSWAKDRPPLTLLDRNPDAKILATPGLRPDGGHVKAVTNSSPAYGNFYVNAKVSDEKLATILKFFDYTIFGAGDKDTHASLIFGEKDVDWKWDDKGEKPVVLNPLKSGEHGTWSFGQFGQTEEVTQWIGEEPLFAAGDKYWSKSQDGVWMKYQEIPYKEDLSNETEYAKMFAESSGDINAYVMSFMTKAITGEVDIDQQWDEYLGELDRLGYTKMMDELNKLDPLEDVIKQYQTSDGK